MTKPLDHLSEEFPKPLTAGKIFLSYSRKDRPYAQALYAKLERMGFDLWRDIVDLEAGADDWWQRIQEAIRESETLLLCMSLSSLKSPVVSDEWFYARTLGKRIIPIVVDDIWDHPEVIAKTFTIPNWMQRKNWMDFRAGKPEAEAAWANLLQTLTRPYEPKRFIQMVGELPPRFVRRPQDADQAIKTLVDDNQDSVAMTTAFKGAGGYGKTTLAKSVARDIRIQGAFDDGILWVTLGEELLSKKGDELKNALIGRVLELIDALSGNRPVVETLDMAHTKLTEAIGDLYILLVIDDVWDENHLKPFLVKGKHTACLITTRNADTVNRKDIQQQPIDKMLPIEAVELLSAGFEPDEIKPLELQFKELAHQLREYPLLLALANTQIANFKTDMKISLEEALTLAYEILESEGVLGFDDGNTDDRTRAIGATIGVSLKQLSDGDRQKYLELAIFPEDTLIPLSTLELYWGLNKVKTLQFCQRLYRKTALLHSFEGMQIRLHDVYRDYLLSQWTGDELQALHARLVSRYDLHTLPDTYSWLNIAYHLQKAEQLPQLRELLLNPQWLQAKLNQTSINDLIGDCRVCLGTTTDDTLRLLDSALGMSAHLMSQDKTALAGQLAGRLMGHRTQKPEIKVFTDALEPPQHLIYPTHLDLPQPTHQQAGEALVRTLEGHNDWVKNIAVSDEYAISASSDKTLRVWNWQTGDYLRTLSGHSSGVNSVALLGEYAISTSSDKTLRVWNWQTGDYLRTLSGHSSEVNSVALSGEYAISASSDKTLWIWNWQTGEVLRTLEGHSSGVNNVALSGEYAISASDDKTLRVWNWQTGEAIRTLEGHDSGVNNVALSGEYAISASSDRTLWVWNWQTGNYLRVLNRHSSWVTSVALWDKYAISASDDKTLRVWNWQTGDYLRTLSGHSSWVNSVALWDKYAISASSDKTLRVWNWMTDDYPQTLDKHSSEVNSVALSGEYAISASGDKTLRVWNWQTGEVLRALQGHSVVVNSVALSGEYAISASGDKTLQVWNWQTGEALRTLEGHSDWVKCVVLSDEYAVSASDDKTLRVWNWQTGAVLRTLEGHSSEVNSVALSGEYAVSASDDKTLRVWSWVSGEHLLTLQGHTYWVNSVALSGEYAISASSDKTIRVWNWMTGEALRTLEGNTAYVNSVGLSGELAISASSDGSLRVWNWQAGQQLGIFYGDAPLLSVATRREEDGLLIVAGDSTGRVLFLRFRLPTPK